MSFDKLDKRTHYCGRVTEDQVGEVVTLLGWLNNKRVVGKKLAFVDLRDREGLLQLVFSNENVEIELIDKTGVESILWVQGEVVQRKSPNPDLKTGMVEVIVKKYMVISPSEELPFALHGYLDVSEELRLRYRYLDLRRPEILQNAIKLRHQVTAAIWKSMNEMGFYHVETPILLKSTPEGARDYLVPSRVHPGKFYALPQSPQLLKQLLMVSGIDRYFQIAKCFRDEDLRADRQPEFTQIDVELAFVTQEDVFKMAEKLMADIFSDVLGLEIPPEFPKYSYSEVKQKYGSDKPDLRIKLFFHDLPIDEVGSFGLDVPQGQPLKVLPCGGLTRKQIERFAQDVGLDKGDIRVVKVAQKLPTELHLGESDFAVVVAPDERGYLSDTHEQLRRSIGSELEDVSPHQFAFGWVVDFPLFDWSETDQAITPSHHPFTHPYTDDLEKMESDPLAVRAYAYDLILNGHEVGGGSIRIHEAGLQKRIFDLLGISDEDAQERFGFLLEAFKYGAPPHGGIAFGFDRLLMILAGLSSIKDVITFPKTKIATCPLTGAPDVADEGQLKELGLRL